MRMSGSRGVGSEQWMPILDAVLMQFKHLRQPMVRMFEQMIRVLPDLPSRPDRNLKYSGRKALPVIPQVVETNIPRPMDAAGECSLYHGFMIRVNHAYMADSRVATIHPGEENG